MEAQFHNLPSESCRPGLPMASNFQLKSKGMSPKRTNDVNLSHQGQEKSSDPSQQPGRESKFSFPLPFYFIQALHGLKDAHRLCGRQSALLSLLIQIIISPRVTFTDIPSNKVHQISGYPVTLSVWHIKLNIIIDPNADLGLKAFQGIGHY